MGNVLKSTSNAELLSFIINQNPVLSENLDLPVQGESIEPIGKLIMGNKVYRNAFINTINLIGLTVIKRNGWDNPWDFTKRGTLRFGQQVREMIADLCNVYDYNANFSDKDRFLETVVPNVLSYIHEVNFQKFYQTTTSDSQLAMAFTDEGGLYNLIYEIVGMLYESLKYDEYLVDKYMLCRRIVDGTVTSVNLITAGKTTREIVSQMKAVVNKMTFRSPNYNPAGIRKANRFEDLYTLLDCNFQAAQETEVLATSYYRNDAEFKNLAKLIDSFSETDETRLTELLGDAFVPFTDAEKTELAKVKAVVVSREWFMDYDYLLDTESAMKETEFYNPTTLENNHFLHAWRVFSTSPFEQAVVFVDDTTPSVSSVSVSPTTATVSKGQNLKLAATVATVGFANKAVIWEISEQAKTSGASINEEGLLKVPSGYTDAAGTQGIYNLTVSTALATDEFIYIDGVKYTAAASADTAAKQATAIYNLLVADAAIAPHYTVTNPSSGVVRFTEKSGYYGIGAPEVDDDDLTTGAVTMATGTAGVQASSPILVTATSVYDDSKSADALITVS
ncbi:MAG: Ig-like domain-containing protein [Methanobrevibacter sp.]|nr:Ig-like domain-containing protein [Methanobrevibacter sp.]